MWYAVIVRTALLGLDIGTTGARCLAIDERGSVVAEATSEYPLHSPRPGWSQQNPEDWWRASCAAVGRVAKEVGPEIAGIGLTGQMHGAVFLDGSAAVIRPALLWNDQRTQRQCDEITQRVGAEALIRIAGNPALTGFQAPKLLWLREEEPEAYARVRRVLLPKDYIRLRLSGSAATDASDASGTLLLDLRSRTWSEEILGALEIPRTWLPDVFEGPEATGAVLSSVADQLALRAGIPVAAGGGDNAAAAVGTGIITAGLASCSIGTSGVLFAHSDSLSPDPSGRLHAFCHAVPDRYHLMGVTLSAGGSLRWWRNVLGPAGYEDLGRLAEQAPAGAEGLVFLPYLSGERSPHLDPFARGAFFGLSSRHSAAHLTRAVMEGVAFSLRDCLDLANQVGIETSQIRATGGGARSDLWRQMLADILGRPIVRTVSDQGPAYGAALLAGVASGIYANVEEACSGIEVRADVCEPDPARARLYQEYLDVYRSLYRSTREQMHALSDLAERSAPLRLD
jgi:xylulokinase